jgi:ribosomal protein S18 acetylase RimI-like enzyme
MVIRPYVAADWPQLCAVHDAARQQELQASGLLDAFLTLEQTAHNEGLFDGTVLVTELSGRVLGFVAFQDCELTWLYVDPAAQRRGVGRALVRAAVQASRMPLELDVLLGNDAALALYLAEGFQVVRRADGRLVGNEAFAASGLVLRHGGGA